MRAVRNSQDPLTGTTISRLKGTDCRMFTELLTWSHLKGLGHGGY